MGSAAPWHVGSSGTGEWTWVSCIGSQILTHCATRKVPSFFFSLNFTYSIWFPVWVLVVCHPIFSVPCACPNFSSIMIRKKTTIQLTHEQQLILSHKMEPLQVVKIMAFAGKGLPFLKASHQCLPLPSTCWNILPSSVIPLLQLNHLKNSCQGIIAFSYHSRSVHPGVPGGRWPIVCGTDPACYVSSCLLIHGWLWGSRSCDCLVQTVSGVLAFCRVKPRRASTF